MEPVIGLTIYETDREVADLSTNSAVRCCRCAVCVKALFPALMVLLGGSGAISNCWQPMQPTSGLVSIPHSSTRSRLRRR